MRSREELAETYGYYHWRCRTCGESGWTDTSPDCSCVYAAEQEKRELEERIMTRAEKVAQRIKSECYDPDWEEFDMQKAADILVEEFGEQLKKEEADND
jgi:hypothetical protein